MAFVHLHVASAFSSHHGTAWPEALVAAAAESGAPAAAITDRDGLSGAVRHIRACIAAGIAPIVGVDLALVPSRRRPGRAGRAPGTSAGGAAAGLPLPDPPTRARVAVLAHGHNDGAGWAALSRLVSAAHTSRRGERAAAAGTVNRTAGLARERFAPFLLGTDTPVGTLLLGPSSDVGLAVAAGERARAERLLRHWHEQLPGTVAVEIVCHLTEPGRPASLRHATRMLELAAACRVPAVLTNQVRYLQPDDAVTGDVLDAAGTLRPLGEFEPQPNAQAWHKPEPLMRALAELVAGRTDLGSAGAERLLAATAELAERAELDPDADVRWRQPKLPEPEVVGIAGDPDQQLLQRCESGITERYSGLRGGDRDRVLRRLGHELATIRNFGFATFFLSVANVTDLIRDMGVRVQARGSGAGSLVNYALRISNVDPLEHDLLFERFLGRARTTLPDIDVDVESARRHDVYHAIFERYGSNRVTLLSMQSRYRARGAVRDAGLALGLDDAQIDLVAKQLWRFDAGQFREAIATKPELAPLAGMLHDDESLDLLVELTERLDRLPRHISMHPCGVLLGNDELLSVTPVQPSGIGLPMSQFDKDDIDDLGLLKLDVLGVRMQSALAFASDEIERIHGPRAALAGGIPVDAPYVTPTGRVVLDDIPHDDEATFEHIRTTNTLGMFQIESPGQRELIGKMQPDEYEDLIADISLFRPGPMKGNMVGPFLDVKHGYTSPQYLHPTFAPFLRETYGVVIYHEHVLRILHLCMGVDLAEADELRRLMEKRGESIEERFRRETAANVDERGRRRYSDADIDRIWRVLEGFGSFGFCKAHGAAFALPTWQSAWLKTHYPAEFFAGLLTHDPGMYPKRLLVGDARRMGIPILPLDVNRSGLDYRVERVRDTPPGQATQPGDLGVRLALTEVQGATAAELDRILSERPFTSLGDVAERARPSRRLFERLALVGALDAVVGVPPEPLGLATISAPRGGGPATVTRGAAATSAPPAPSRTDVVARVRELSAGRRAPARRPDEAQLPMLFDVHGTIEPRLPPPAPRERVIDELDILGIDLSEHVIDSYRPMLDELGVTRAGDLLDLRGGSDVLVAGIRVATQTPPMRSGKRVVFISVDDGTGCADATFFDEAQHKSGPLLFGTKLLVIRGTTRRTGERGVSIQAKQAWDLKQLWSEWNAAGAAAQTAAAAGG
ncbi:DNA-directed DNA polymerase [Pseudoclavibacter endophyticus]|uniref:DNA-directed DNA polymerase n=1 Tax=Pseudoclavibacter endophyticus TaxID=1778590 RepID=A0A6H9WAK6_9MICO|nr:DNA polymerase III subunit alpha [Pseudoclavibacter endophyticus]KAB1646867.1 DNA polymerase III subunit alpha [Pseudoclavibacter endophyticus]GGA74876.1 DNA-directed DNA polymerase [Pseudoclavibacter endophyticus]